MIGIEPRHRARKLFATVALLTAFLLSASGAEPARASRADPSSPERCNRTAAQAHGSVEGLMAERSLPGFSAAVAVDGKIVWSAALGECDLEKLFEGSRGTRHQARIAP